MGYILSIAAGVIAHTIFFASKKFLRCLICHTPMTMRMSVCPRDHHRTRALVVSLVCLNRSSLIYGVAMATVN